VIGQLIEVATRLFAEHGYEGASVEAVPSAVGVSRRALYHQESDGHLCG
jgi:AcrR family transcriptional regulator